MIHKGRNPGESHNGMNLTELGPNGTSFAASLKRNFSLFSEENAHVLGWYKTDPGSIGGLS
jgi:hypothetical protein